MSAWTPDRVARLRTLWKEGRSAAEISRDLQNGISRSAVLGKVHRLGLSLDRENAPRPGPATPASHARVQGLEPRPSRLPPQALPASEPEVRGDASILSVRNGDCRWPIGDPRDQGFSLCGCPATRGAFCDRHAARAYRPKPPSAENLMGLLRYA